MAPNDADGRVELALDSSEAGASTLAQRILQSVLDPDPDHPDPAALSGTSAAARNGRRTEECHRQQRRGALSGTLGRSEERAALEALHHARRANQPSACARRSSSSRRGCRRTARRRRCRTVTTTATTIPTTSRRSLLSWLRALQRLRRRALTGGRFEPGRFPDHHGRLDHGRRVGHPGSVSGRFQGGLHHQGGQPACPLAPTHARHSLSPPR